MRTHKGRGVGLRTIGDDEMATLRRRGSVKSVASVGGRLYEMIFAARSVLLNAYDSTLEFAILDANVCKSLCTYRETMWLFAGGVGPRVHARVGKD